MVNPAWQNFSSLYREAVAAEEAKTGMERSHHLTSALYFGISALEAFLNSKMRSRLQGTKSDEEIFDILRRERLGDKIKKWPKEILGISLALEQATFERILLFKNVRDSLTHIKTPGHDLYEDLEDIEPSAVVATIAEYLVRFHQQEGTQFHYWVFGYNYLNPRPDSYEIILINNQQFVWSLQAIGFEIPGRVTDVNAEAWQRHYLGTFDGYIVVRESLNSAPRCEPKSIFPYQPKLCRRWWTAEHQRTCGHVTNESIALARKLADSKNT